MHKGTLLPPRTGPAQVALRMSSLAVILLAITVSAFAQHPSPKPQMTMPVAVQQGGKIDFPNTLIPRIPNTLPILKLTAQAPPQAFLRETLGKIGIADNFHPPIRVLPEYASSVAPTYSDPYQRGMSTEMNRPWFGPIVPSPVSARRSALPPLSTRRNRIARAQRQRMSRVSCDTLDAVED